MAAAYAALVSLSNDLELIQNHSIHSFSFENKQIQSLLHIISFLIEFMESYDNSHGPTKKAAQILEMSITRAAHEAEEVIESHVVNQIGSGSTLDGKKRSRFLLDVQKAIEHMEFVRRKAIKITKSLKQPTNLSAAVTAATASSSSTPLTSEKNSMVGFDDVLFQLLDLLTGSDSSRRVIPIVGTGGIGKTTLAKCAFDHPLTVNHFDIRIWATISQEYVVKDILLKLLSREKESNGETVSKLREELHKKLYGRRYLIVLDDMWSVEAWDQMSLCCPDRNNGSRVVVTTRQSNVADCVGSSRLAMSFLDEGKSWDLFCKKAFGEHGCPVELEDVGKRIVEKCRGLPLAIVVVAGHLVKSSKSLEYWENVADNMNSVLSSEENKNFHDILSFSYSYLPAHLKPCFIYVGTYAEDDEIYIPDLINSWIAEGFIKTCEAKDLEEIGEDYLKDLIGRNLILPIFTIEDGVFDQAVGIHDVLRELCLKIAEKEKLFYVIHGPEEDICICRERDQGVLDAPPLVRSLKCNYGVDELSFDLRFMRILKLVQGSHGGDVEPVNLRYVCGAWDQLGSLSLLWNLQTLFIESDDDFVFVLYEFWEMVQLRVLQVVHLPGVHVPDPLPSDQVMQNLQKLWGLVNLKLSEEVCKRIPNIKELGLLYDDTESESLRSSSYYYCLHNLGRFLQLESLVISFHSDADASEWLDQLPSSLKKLHLMHCHLYDWEKITRMSGSLPRLESLVLFHISFIEFEWILDEEKFPRLKSLTISECDDLVYWNAYSTNFPVLEYLVIEDMLNLDEIPWGIGEIPTLQSIKLSECSDELMISAARMVMEGQEEHGNEDLKLEFVFYDKDGRQESFKEKLEQEGLTTIGNLTINQEF